MLVYVWFPHETYFILYFFIVPPSSFFIFDIENSVEKKILIGINVLAAGLALVFGLLKPLELISLTSEQVVVFRAMSIISTVFTEILVFYFYASSLAKTHRELKVLANTNALTRIANRRVLFEQGELMMGIFTKYQKPFTLMILDIDHFKQINDQYGHPAGDKVLIELTKVISENIRKEDLVSRYGGEEFAVIFRNMDSESRHIITNIKDKLDAFQFSVNDTVKISLTISAGVATCHGRERKFEDIVKRADDLLYKAKQTGRNKIVFD